MAIASNTPTSAGPGTMAQYLFLMLAYATLTMAISSPQPSTMTAAFDPVSMNPRAAAQAWPTAAATGTGGDASQWSGTGGAGAGACGPAQLTSMFTLDLEAIRTAHAMLASACMLIFFPFGGIILRLIPPEKHAHIVWFHAGVQMFAYTIFLGAAGLGIWMAVHFDVTSSHHPIIGMVVLGLLSFQPITEILNHYLYAKYPKIIALGYTHIWIGRVVITLGIINGGLGFPFADTIPNQPIWSKAPRIAYVVLAGVVWVSYFGICGILQQAKYVRRTRGGGDAGGMSAEEMESLRGRALREVGQENGTGSLLDVNKDDEGGKRRTCPRPTDLGFRSGAL